MVPKEETSAGSWKIISIKRLGGRWKHKELAKNLPDRLLGKVGAGITPGHCSFWKKHQGGPELKGGHMLVNRGLDFENIIQKEETIPTREERE